MTWPRVELQTYQHRSGRLYNHVKGWSEVAEVIFSDHDLLLFHNFFIRIRVRNFFKFENPTPVQTPTHSINKTEIKQYLSFKSMTFIKPRKRLLPEMKRASGSGASVKRNF